MVVVVVMSVICYSPQRSLKDTSSSAKVRILSTKHKSSWNSSGGGCDVSELLFPTKEPEGTPQPSSSDSLFTPICDPL